MPNSPKERLQRELLVCCVSILMLVLFVLLAIPQKDQGGVGYQQALIAKGGIAAFVFASFFISRFIALKDLARH